ncbi:MAG: Holliday junction resolvase RuvX [Clostridiales bacterium]|jgi:putative Holliday junction resolvase|nr:Holliday junction resolvase RuvX [Clostridiales bacterium]
MSKKTGLDIGDVRIGVAVSDLLGLIANPRETYTRQTPKKDAEYFKSFVEREGIDEMVLGLPVNMDGTSGERVKIVRAYGDMLQENIPGIKISYMDERLTTVQAERSLIASDMRRDKRKQVIDQVAACIILQSHLDKLSRR